MSDQKHTTLLKCHACGRDETVQGKTISEYAKAFGRAVEDGKWMPRPNSRVPYLWCGTCAEEYERGGLPRDEFEAQVLVRQARET